MSKQIEHQEIEYQAPPLEGILQSPLQMHRLFKTRDAALDFAKFMREGDVLIQRVIADGKKMWQLTYNKGENY